MASEIKRRKTRTCMALGRPVYLGRARVLVLGGLVALMLIATSCGQASPPVPPNKPAANNRQPAGNTPAPERKISRAKVLDARDGHNTRLTSSAEEDPYPPDDPEGSPFELVHYKSPVGDLAAYITRDPADGKKHPAVIWCKGGFGGIGSWLWERAPKDNDQSTRAFFERKFVVMCPSWRGENDNPGRYEMFYGEVEDLLAALEYLKGVSWVDPDRIYLAGHSTGGTMALLGACATDEFRAVFSFGGAPDIYAVVEDGEGWGNTPYDYQDREESRLRSPHTFVGAITTPTFYFEGEESFYPSFARAMAKDAREVGAPFYQYEIKGGDHFTILYPMVEKVARKIKADTGETCNIGFRSSDIRIQFD